MMMLFDRQIRAQENLPRPARASSVARHAIGTLGSNRAVLFVLVKGGGNASKEGKGKGECGEEPEHHRGGHQLLTWLVIREAVTRRTAKAKVSFHSFPFVELVLFGCFCCCCCRCKLP